jgi:hydroxyethylthiazole kinase-like sugar kinase family protein
VLNFGHLSPHVKDVLRLIQTASKKSTPMIFDLLQAMCAVEGIRSSILQYLLSTLQATSQI